MSWRNGPWRLVARLTHLEAAAQRRLWRALILVWSLLLLAGWTTLAALTRAEEKAGEAAGQTYVTVAPLAAEVMDLRARKGQFEGQPPILAAEQVAKTAGIDQTRLRIQLAPDAATPAAGGSLSLHAQGLTLRELVEMLRDLKVEAGLGTVSTHLGLTPGQDDRMDLDMVLAR